MSDKIRFILVSALTASGLAFGQTPSSSQPTSELSPPFVPWNAEAPLSASGSKPVYPPIAVAARVEGCVYVGVTVTGGSTNDVSYYVGPPLLLKAATDAVLTWKLKPSKQAIKTVVPICFFIPPNAPQNLLASYQKAVAKHPNANNFGALAYERLLVRSPNDAEGYFRQALALKAADPDYDFGFGDIFMCRWSL